MGYEEGKSAREGAVDPERAELDLRDLFVLHPSDGQGISVLDSLEDLISIQDVYYRVIFQNSAHRTFFGTHVGSYCYEAYRQRDEVCSDCPLAGAIATGRPRSNERMLTGPDGRRVHLEVTSSPLRNGEGVLIGGIQLSRNVTERRLAAHRLRDSYAELDQIFNTAAGGMRLIDGSGRILKINSAFAAMAGIRPEDAVGRQCYEVFPGPACHTSECAMRRITGGGEPRIEAEFAKTKCDGGKLICLLTATPFLSAEGEFLGIVEDFRDITERKKAEDALKLNESRLEALLQLKEMQIKSEVDITDFALEEAVRLTGSIGGYLHFFNEEYQTIELHSWSKAVLAACKAAEIQHYPLDDAGVWADSIRLRRAVIHNDYQGLPHKRGYPAGHFHVTRHLGVPIFDNEKIVGVTGVANKAEPYDDSDVRQITLFMESMWAILKQRRGAQERERLILELRSLSITDELTGLHNRRGFYSFADHEIKTANRDGRGFYLLYVDLDGLKKINDDQGHEEGDKILISAAELLMETFRGSDIIARMGGDEFVIMPIRPETGDIGLVVSRLQTKIKEHNLRQPAGRRISMSVGGAFYDPSSPCSLDALLTIADNAMYEAKRDKKK